MPCKLTLVFSTVLFLTALDLEPAPAQPSTAATKLDNFGDPLPVGAVQRLGSSRLRPGGFVASAAVSPDGRLLVTTIYSKAALVWDFQTGKLLHRLEHNKGVGTCFLFTADSKRLYTYTGELHLWDLQTGKEIQAIKVDGPHMQQVALSPDEKTLAISREEILEKKSEINWDCRYWIELREAKSGALIRTIGERQPKWIGALAFTPDGKTLFALEQPHCQNAAIVRFDPASGKQLGRLELNQPVDWPRFSQDRKVFCCYGIGPKPWKGLQFWDLEKNRLLPIESPGADGCVQSCILVPGSKRMLFSNFRTIRPSKHENDAPIESGKQLIWDLERDQIIGMLAGPPGIAPECSAPDGRMLVGWDLEGRGAIHRWDLAANNYIPPPGTNRGAVANLAWSPDSKQVATTGADRALRLWEAQTGKELLAVKDCFRSLSDWRWYVVFARHGKSLLVGNNAGRVWVDAETGNRTEPTDAEHQGFPVVNADGTRAAMMYGFHKFVLDANDGRFQLQIWDVATKQKIGTWPVPWDVTPLLAWSPDGKKLAGVKSSMEFGAPNTMKTIFLWDVEKGRLEKVLPESPSIVTHLFFTADGRTLVSGTDSGVVQIWDLPGGKELRRFHHESPNGFNDFHLAASADGKWIATGGEYHDEPDGTISLWNAATGKLLRKIPAHIGGVAALAFSPDGRFLASGSSDTTVLIWDIAQLVKAPAGN